MSVKKRTPKVFITATGTCLFPANGMLTVTNRQRKCCENGVKRRVFHSGLEGYCGFTDTPTSLVIMSYLIPGLSVTLADILGRIDVPNSGMI